jgi:hypothetical protein
MNLNAKKNERKLVSPTQCICVLYDAHNKQQSFTQTALAGCHFQWTPFKIRIEVLNVIY